MTLPAKLSCVALVCGLALTACGGSDDPVSLDTVWARASAPSQPNGAVYFELSSNVDDVLTGAAVDASVAADAQVHEAVEASMDDASGDMSGAETSDDDDSGDMEMAMTMQELTAGLPLADGEVVVFEPGGYHVMLLDLVDPLEVGDEIEVTLEFADADDLTITVPVREAAP